MILVHEASAKTDYFASGRRKVPFNVAKGHGEVMHECFPKQSRMLTAKTKYDKKTDEDGKKRGVCMERSKAGTKKQKSRLPITF